MGVQRPIPGLIQFQTFGEFILMCYLIIRARMIDIGKLVCFQERLGLLDSRPCRLARFGHRDDTFSG